MDAVITYVNGLDPIWQAEYAALTKQPVLEKRYRDWGLLPYLLRGIEVNMPFIENVYLVVSHPSQVPEWVNTKQLHIVLHTDIIPSAYLPTFNSTTIELFLHRIEGLSEQFIYFNDDIYPVRPLHQTDFFQENKIVMRFTKHYFAWDMYKKQTRQAARLAQEAVGKKSGIAFIRPQHTCTPMYKSVSQQIFKKMEKALMSRITPLREDKNVNQYIFTDYLYYLGRTIEQPIPTKHCSMAVYSPKGIARHIIDPKRALICINDVAMSEDRQTKMRTTLQQAFQTVLPQKSRFEK